MLTQLMSLMRVKKLVRLLILIVEVYKLTARTVVC